MQLDPTGSRPRGIQCYSHPGRPGVAVCPECLRSLCAACAARAAPDGLCANCQSRIYPSPNRPPHGSGETGSDIQPCYQHPYTPARAFCIRCRRPLCKGCAWPVQGYLACRDCVPLVPRMLAQRKRPGGLAWLGRALTVIGLGCVSILVLVLLIALFAGGPAATTTGRPRAASPTVPADSTRAGAAGPRAVSADPGAYAGRNVELIGRAVEVTQYPAVTWLRLKTEKPEQGNGESLVVELRPRQSGIVRGECYRISAVAREGQAGTLNAYAWERLPAPPGAPCRP